MFKWFKSKFNKNKVDKDNPSGIKLSILAPEHELTDEISLIYVSQLKEMLRNKNVRNVAITGDLGIGKVPL